MNYLKKKTIYILIIILLLVLICIEKKNIKYGYKNIDTFEVECNDDDDNINEDLIKKESDKEYIRIINCDTKKIKKRLSNLHQYYIYKMLETIFLKKTEINVLSLLVKNENKCNNYCMLKTKRNIALITNQVSNLEKIINDFELEDKDSFIEEQLKCITKNNIKAQKECMKIIQSNYYDDKKSEDDIKKECVDKYGIDDEICSKSATEISFIMSKNKCIESHKTNEKECIKIPEEIEFMTQPNISKYIQELEEQIKKQEPKLNRFLCYKCIKRIKDEKDELNDDEKIKCKEVCKDIVEDIQERKKEDYEKQKKIFLEQQQQMNEYYEKQYKQNDGITSKTLKKIFNGEESEAGSENEYIYDIYNNIDVKKYKITEFRFNEIFHKINKKINNNVELNNAELKDLEILFNNNYTNKYMGFLSKLLRVLKYKKILTDLKKNIVTVEEEQETIYDTESNENKDILSHTGYNKQKQINDINNINDKEFEFGNLPEFYDLTKVRLSKNLQVNFMDLHGSPLPMTDNIYNSKSFSFV
mgnify:CR=1 FL=1